MGATLTIVYHLAEAPFKGEGKGVFFPLHLRILHGSAIMGSGWGEEKIPSWSKDCKTAMFGLLVASYKALRKVRVSLINLHTWVLMGFSCSLLVQQGGKQLCFPTSKTF